MYVLNFPQGSCANYIIRFCNKCEKVVQFSLLYISRTTLSYTVVYVHQTVAVCVKLCVYILSSLLHVLRLFAFTFITSSVLKRKLNSSLLIRDEYANFIITSCNESTLYSIICNQIGISCSNSNHSTLNISLMVPMHWCIQLRKNRCIALFIFKQGCSGMIRVVDIPIFLVEHRDIILINLIQLITHLNLVLVCQISSSDKKSIYVKS